MSLGQGKSPRKAGQRSEHQSWDLFSFDLKSPCAVEAADQGLDNHAQPAVLVKLLSTSYSHSRESTEQVKSSAINLSVSSLSHGHSNTLSPACRASESITVNPHKQCSACLMTTPEYVNEKLSNKFLLSNEGLKAISKPFGLQSYDPNYLVITIVTKTFYFAWSVVS